MSRKGAAHDPPPRYKCSISHDVATVLLILAVLLGLSALVGWGR